MKSTFSIFIKYHTRNHDQRKIKEEKAAKLEIDT